MRWPLGLYRVEGESMAPVYRAGDLLLGARWLHPRVGRAIVARRDLPLVKRLKRIEPAGYWIEGDNASASTDSRSFGPVPRTQIEATIVARIARAS